MGLSAPYVPQKSLRSTCASWLPAGPVVGQVRRSGPKAWPLRSGWLGPAVSALQSQPCSATHSCGFRASSPALGGANVNSAAAFPLSPHPTPVGGARATLSCGHHGPVSKVACWPSFHIETHLISRIFSGFLQQALVHRTCLSPNRTGQPLAVADRKDPFPSPGLGAGAWRCLFPVTCPRVQSAPCRHCILQCLSCAPRLPCL